MIPISMGLIQQLSFPHAGGSSMSERLRQAISFVLVFGLVMSVTQDLIAQNPVIHASELQAAIVRASESRDVKLAAARDLVSSVPGAEVLQVGKTELVRVNEASTSLTDDELSQLAAQASRTRTDFAAGTSRKGKIAAFVILGVGALLLITAIRSARSV